MKRVCLWFIVILFPTFNLWVFSAPSDRNISIDIHRLLEKDYERVRPYFSEAYSQYPSIPRGILESIAFNYTRFAFFPSDTVEKDALAIPKTYSVMGLTLHGKGVFRENLRLISSLSEYHIFEIIENERIAILAYAKAFSVLQSMYDCETSSAEDCLPVLIALSELPCHNLDFKYAHTMVQSVDLRQNMFLFPLLSSLYVCYRFMNDTLMRPYGGGNTNVDFDLLFGSNLNVLQNDTLRIDRTTSDGTRDYASAIWCPAAVCNYATGRSLTPSNVVIHYTSGTYAGAIAWFMNCQAQASSHYVIRSVDGQVTQMVSESDRAWHVGSENGYTIGIEHEAYGNVYSFFTPIMYEASALLVRDICSRRPSINPKRTFYRDTLDDGSVLNYGVHNLGGRTSCTQIRGHQHYPGQTHTDPGPYWDWNYYYKLLNSNTPVENLTGISGMFYDSGGLNSNYGNDERRLIRISVPGADSIRLSFFSFDLQSDFDFLFVYAGDNVYAPLHSRWNTQTPGNMTLPGDCIMVEFRSDCAGTGAGWQAQWIGVFNTTHSDTANPVTQIVWDEQFWVTQDFDIDFVDTDDSLLQYRFYQIVELENNEWTGNASYGFLCDNFDHSLDDNLWDHDGHWSVEAGRLCQSDPQITTSRAAVRFSETEVDTMLFDFYLSMDAGDVCSFFFQANVADINAPDFCGYNIVFDKHNHTVSLYKIMNGSALLVGQQTNIYFSSGIQYLYRIIWDKISHTVKLFRHTSLLMTTIDRGVLPCSCGEYVGFSTQHSAISVDNLRSYRTRTCTQRITVGENAMIHTQAYHGQSRCKVKSLVVDAAHKFSPLVEVMLKVDYTPPSTPQVWDGLVGDVDFVMVRDREMLGAHWASVIDENSDILAYYYCFLTDTSDLGQERIAWICSGIELSGTLNSHQTLPFRVFAGVKVENRAGLFSDIAFSNGALYVQHQSPNFFRILSNPVSKGIPLHLSLSEDVSEEGHIWTLYDHMARIVWQGKVHRDGFVHITSGLEKGMYLLSLSNRERILQVEKFLIR